ncbi:DUF2851 family protein [Flavobacteriaceae bacterium SZ-1-7]|uniref:DUF2851 family protein n=1 Tax=Tamlana sedimenti TaxID=3134126 RepID=UPI003120CAFE
MREDFLHYIWKHKKFSTESLQTTASESISITSLGQHNLDSGPDFFNAQMKIGEQLWAGNVEIHVKSSDWFLHSHETDKTYDNVILHVVWEHDTDVFRKDNTPIPTLQLKGLIDTSILNNYEKLFSKKNKWINCENDFGDVNDFVLNNWLERLFFERLERKSKDIEALLIDSKNDWEAVFFKMLAKNFGLKVNGESFFSLANSIDFSIIRKTRPNQNSLEALLFGQAGFLDEDLEGAYFKKLKQEYMFLTQKFQLKNSQVLPIQFFRLRPSNFPTIRLSQLASLYQQHQNLFSKVVETNKLEDFYELFKVSTSKFWKNHYTFQKESKPSEKRLSKSFIDLLLINTVIPVTFCYAKHQGKDIEDTILNLATSINSEKNNIVDAFNNLKKVSQSSFESQAFIQLKTTYCDTNKCLQCAIGNTLLSRNI